MRVNGFGNFIEGFQRCLLIGEFGSGWLNNKSRMSREVHVRFCEKLKGEIPFGLLDPWGESFFGSLKQERVQWRYYQTRFEAQQDVLNYISMFYNSFRLHSYLGYVSPNQYEAEMAELKKVA